MNLTTENANGVAVVRIGESRLMYPLLSEFSTAVTQLIAAGERKVVVDLSSVGYVDSATIGCLMDLYRQANAAGGGAQARGRPEARRDDVDDDRCPELHRGSPRRAERRQKLRSVAMRTIKMTNGTNVTLDGDLLAVLESLYIEVTAKRELERTFEDMVREIQHLIEQMTDEERRQYLSESLFLNTVSYENERLGAYMKKLTRK
jgi:ABC-type transporter Mla MlaB component